MAVVIPSLENMIIRGTEFYRKFFHGDPSFAGVAPGSVNVIGEHTDYNDGYVLPMALPNVTIMVGGENGLEKIKLATDDQRFVSEGTNCVSFCWTSKEKLLSGSPIWVNYPKAVISLFPYQFGGFNAVIVSSVPITAGLSSSTALEVATCSFLEAITATKMDLDEKIKLCLKANQSFVGTSYGKLNYLACVKGMKNEVLAIDCRSFKMDYIEFNDDSIVFLIINTRVKHRLAASIEYSKIKSDCEMVSKLLNVKSLRDVTENQIFDLMRKGLITERTFRRARHVIEENVLVCQVAQAFRKCDYVAAGQFMSQSHCSLRSDYGVSCAELDNLIEIVSKLNGVFGCRMTGDGFGGCTINLVKKECVMDIVKTVQEKYQGSIKPDVFIAMPSDGARMIDLRFYKKCTDFSITD